MRRHITFVSILLTHSWAASAGEADALAISKNIQNRHFPHYTKLDPIFDSPTGDRIVSYTRCGDSALWTGLYLAAESFRYNVTRSGEALAAARRAVAGIQSLVDVTGNNVLARCVIPESSPYAVAIQMEEAPNGIYRSGPGDFWVGNTSRDQYSGVLFGLGAAYDLIDDPALRSSIVDLVTRLVRFLTDHEWNIVLPSGAVTTTFLSRPDQQLAFLQLARRLNPDQFSAGYDVVHVLLSPFVIAPISVDVLSDDSYFKFNLDTINLYTLNHFSRDESDALYRKAYDILRNHTDDHRNAFFNMIDAALNGPNAVRDAETRTLLDQWLQRPRRDLEVRNEGKYATCGDPNQACQPIPVPDRPTSDFLWQRSPFQLSNQGGSNIVEGAGIDYILPYWMARYYGVLAADKLQEGSAASYAPTLAADAIASVFGLALPAADGVKVTVKDSAAMARPATLLFASASQVNFIVPGDTAAGTASITIQRTGSPDTILSAEIRTIAPGLFSADATGQGAAAATAIRVIGGQANAVPVFSCQGPRCGTVAIDLGVDTPVYLSLYGTGIRHRSLTTNVTCTVGGISVPVLYAGLQPVFAGLDQVNVLLPLSLRGLGEADLVVTVDGRPSNTVRVNLR
jgi:uncharacterized protein (TIGR03437 family)